MLRLLLFIGLALAFTTQASAEPTQRAKLKKVLATRRAKNLAAFKAYVTAGVYPHNEEAPGELNIWIDDEGHRCAAAQMIWASGAHAMVEQQAAADNFIRLANATDGPLLDWILTSGLTHDEVVLIQRPFVGRPQRPEKPLVNWRLAADRALRVKYDGILRELARGRNASLESAVDALMARPDLVAAMLG